MTKEVEHKHKKCSKCGKTFGATTQYFHIHHTNKDGSVTLRSDCKDCRNKQEIERRYKKTNTKSNLVDKTIFDWTKERVGFIDLDDLDDYLESVPFSESIGYDDVYFETSKKCAIAFISDLHVGNVHTVHKYMTYLFRLIRDTEDFYVILGGDYCDNYTNVRGRVMGGIYEMVIPVPKQKETVKTLVETLSNRILGVIQGCHDEWMFKTNEFDFSQYLASHSKTGKPLGFEAVIHLKVGEVDYNILARHRYPKWSSTNPCNGLLQYVREHHHDIDVVFGGHRHVASMSDTYIDKKLVLAIRPSAFKITDRWQAHRGFPKSPLIIPCVILYPDTKKIQYIKTIEHAVELMRNET